MSQANIGRWKAALGDGNSPEVFIDIEEVFSVTNMGVAKNLEDVTNFDSPEGEREYIGGLRDGSEISIEANYIPDAVTQLAMVDAVEGDSNVNMVLTYSGVSPAKSFEFNAVPMAWGVTPSPTERNTISFTVKVSGGITRS